MAYRQYKKNRTIKKDLNETRKLVDRIEKTAAQGISILTDWERNFLSSVRENAEKWGRLSSKQHDIFQRIEKKVDPANIKAVNDWRANYTDEMRQKATFAAKYYKANPPYYGEVADRILNDSEYILPEKLYRKMVENKYVSRAFENVEAPALYPAGSLATVRNNGTTAGLRRLYTLRDKNVLIISIDEHTLNSTKGSKKYTVLPVGATETIKVEERHLKKAKKS